MRIKIKYHNSMFEKYRIFNVDAQSKMVKYFLKIKDHTHNIFSSQIGQDKTGKSILTSPQHHCCNFAFVFVRLYQYMK